jgi:hypothetical protein|tara:strand:+ start:54 stop:2165 length:2112 start_codon:yes stop_codon:yes gene_type:complete
MAMFKAFKPSGMEKIARSMGYQGNMLGFQDYLAQDPMRQQQMQTYTNQAMQMARGGVVKMQEGGTVQLPQQVVPTTTGVPEGANLGDIMAQQAFTPGLPAGGAVAPVGQVATEDQIIDSDVGQVSGPMTVPTAMAGTTQADPVVEAEAAQIKAANAAPAVDAALDATQAAQGTVDPRAQITAAQQTTSSVGNLEAAQGNAILIDNPVQREIQQGELIEPTFNAEKAAKFSEEIQAAQATPSKQATVQGQLEGLMQQFEGGETPTWAAGAMRNAMAGMQARGLGASSVAGQAAIQAAMESALPIAQADASTVAKFESQNLSNRQQRAMLAAQQRASFIGQEFNQAFQARVMNASKISDIANMNFTAEQQVALENARAANSVNLANLNNQQALVMAEAAALSQLDMANLNNRQQASVMNAQAFLQMDMANLSNRQQTSMFKAQQRIQSLFTDQAAENAARQFNATSENQVNQFFASLSSQVSQFNAAQSNAQSQFNAGQRNTVERFNAELNNQRDQFNAQNQLVIAQNNAQWRREISTANTAAINRANELNATALLDVSKNAYDNLWQYYGDTMEWAWTSAENELDRLNSMAIAQLSADAQAAATKAAGKTAAGSAIGGLIGTLGSAFIEFCWVAREVYGPADIRWFMFRSWMKKNAPRWLFNLYVKHGKDFAEYIKDKPKIKFILRQMMNLVVNKRKVRYNYAN